MWGYYDATILITNHLYGESTSVCANECMFTMAETEERSLLRGVLGIGRVGYGRAECTGSCHSNLLPLLVMMLLLC